MTFEALKLYFPHTFACNEMSLFYWVPYDLKLVFCLYKTLLLVPNVVRKRNCFLKNLVLIRRGKIEGNYLIKLGEEPSSKGL